MYKKIKEIIPEERLYWQEPLSAHTTFKVGGPADLLVVPQTIGEIKELLRICNTENIPYVVLGLGSNIIFRDKGFRGVVIKLGHSLKSVYITGEEIMAEAGIRLSELSKKRLLILCQVWNLLKVFRAVSVVQW